MVTTVAALYESTKEKYRLHLHTRNAGLSNAVYWVYATEDIQNIPFLKGGELVITTGLFVQSGITLMDFVRTVSLYSGSGVLVNTGKYLQAADITDEITAFCDGCGLPVFSMPWEMHLVDIMQDCSILLMKNLQNEELLSATLQNALYQEPVQQNALRLLVRFGFPEDAKYRLLAIQNIQNPVHITAQLNASGLKYQMVSHENLWVILYAEPEARPSLNEIIDMICYYGSVRVGVSDMVPALTGISLGYKQARFALKAAAMWQRRFVVFEESGVFQLLFEVSPQRLAAFRQRQLGALEEYDRLHQTDYCDTLHVYLMCEGSIRETSRRLYAHRNTIIYRLGRIREILGTDMAGETVKFDLLMACNIRDYFNIE